MKISSFVVVFFSLLLLIVHKVQLLEYLDCSYGINFISLKKKKKKKYVECWEYLVPGVQTRVLPYGENQKCHWVKRLLVPIFFLESRKLSEFHFLLIYIYIHTHWDFYFLPLLKSLQLLTAKFQFMLFRRKAM